MAPPGNPRTQAGPDRTGPGTRAFSARAADPGGQCGKNDGGAGRRRVSGARASSLLVRITAAPRRLIAIVRSAIKQELHAKLAADGRTATARRRCGDAATEAAAASAARNGDRPITACYIDPFLPRDSINNGETQADRPQLLLLLVNLTGQQPALLCGI